MLRLLRSEIYRMRRRWMPWSMLALIVVMVGLLYVLLSVTINAQLQAIRSGQAPPTGGPGGGAGGVAALEQTLATLRPEHVQQFGMPAVIGIGTVMLVVFAASHVGTEYAWGTLRTLLAHGAGRGGFFVAKLVSILLFAVAFVVVGALAAIAASFAVAALNGTAAGPLDVEAIASGAAKGLYTFLPYTALAVMIASVARSSGASIAIGLLIVFAESIVAQLAISVNRDLASVANLGLDRNADAINRVAGAAPPQGAPAALTTTLPDAAQAALVLAAWTIAFLAIGYWRLGRRDVTLA